MTGLAFAALTLSLGGGHRVVGRLTFDRHKAAQGGFVYAARLPGPADEEAIRLSQALLCGAAGAQSPGARIARRHGVPALALSGAQWADGALVLSRPVFGAPASSGGASFRPVTGYEDKRLAEGDAVAVDPADGLVEPVDASELELADALRAFDGLRDLQALLQWHDARSQSGPSPVLAARLVEEVAARLAAGEATAEEFSRLRRSLDAGLDAEGRKTTADAAASAARRQLRACADRLDELSDDAAQAGSRAALDRLLAEASAAEAGARALAVSVGRAALAEPVVAAASRVRRAAAARRAALPARPADPARALAAAGAPPPARVELPGSLYERYVADHGLAAPLADISSDASLDLRRKERRLAALFTSAPLSPESGAGAEILARLPKAPLLSVCGPEGCLEHVPSSRALSAVRDAWAMSWTGAALGRRLRGGQALQSPALAVSAFVPAHVSGVVESRDPVTGRLASLLVSCVFGEPDALAAGDAQGDEYVLSRAGLAEAAPPLVVEKRVRLDADPGTGELKRSTAPAAQASARCLTPEQAARAAAAARALDDALGQGVEVTFAVSDGRLVSRTWRATAR